MLVRIECTDKKTGRKTAIARELDTLAHLYVVNHAQDLDYDKAKPIK